jgi:hypothetical protein
MRRKAKREHILFNIPQIQLLSIIIKEYKNACKGSFVLFIK